VTTLQTSGKDFKFSSEICNDIFQLILYNFKSLMLFVPIRSFETIAIITIYMFEIGAIIEI